MAVNDTKLTRDEYSLIRRALELLETSYARAQKQRPEFKEVAMKQEQAVSQLINKLSDIATP